MSAPIWYLGPDWDLQPLVCPEPDIAMPPVRFGGIFQGLSGARSMTVTGVKESYGFVFEYLDPDEYLRLEALQRRTIPGPHRLISPLRVNRLSPAAAEVKPVPGVVTSNTGVAVFQGTLVQQLDWPTAAGSFGALSTRWIIPQGMGNYARFDSAYRFPVFPAEEVTASIFLKSPTVGATLLLGIDWFDKLGQQVGGGNVEVVLTSDWVRYTLTRTAPAGACSGRLMLVNIDNDLVGSTMSIAAAQVEAGASATAWTPGGGAPRVLIDQLDTKSPRYPYMDTTLTLLEA
jgi:hypothetical protein